MSVLAPDQQHDDAMPAAYKALPEGIKAYVSLKEWLWLSDAEKARLVQTETEPDWIEP